MTVRAEAGTIGTGEQDAAVVLSVDGPISNSLHDKVCRQRPA
jgi:hypothetical protein